MSVLLSNLKDLLRTDREEHFKFLCVRSSEIGLEETHGGHNVSKVTLNNICLENVAILKCPSAQSSYFKDGGARKICDYIILCQASAPDPRIDVIFVELKKHLTDKKAKDGMWQILCTVPIMYYIVAALRIHFQHKFKIREMRQHYLLWESGKNQKFLDKRRMKQQKSKVTAIVKADSELLSDIGCQENFYTCKSKILNFSEILEMLEKDHK